MLAEHSSIFYDLMVSQRVRERVMNAGVGDACTSGSSYSASCNASCNASWAELGSAAGGLTAARLPCLPYAPAPPYYVQPPMYQTGRRGRRTYYSI